MKIPRNKTELQFFALLRAGLWVDREVEVELFEEPVNWAAIFRLSKEQAVVGVVWDGLVKLPSQFLPPRQLKMEWYSYVVQVEKTNQMLNERVVEIFKRYSEAGLRPLLLKGQGIATLYPNALRRGCGDIDIYVGEDGYATANKVMVDLGANDFEESGGHHSHLSYRGVSIENHHRLTTHFSATEARRFDQLWQKWSVVKESVDINECAIEVLAAPFNVQYLFLHLYRHLMMGGVGLRQVCDWALLLDRYSDRDVELIGSRSAWSLFGWVAVDYLGLDSSRVTSSFESRKKSERLVSLILDEGNFGSNDTERHTARPKGYVAGKLFSACWQFRRGIRVFGLFPKDTMRYIFGFKIKESIALIIRERL